MADYYYENGYQSAARAAGAESSQAVRELQKKLNAAGASLAIDGIYGPKTDAAWKQYSGIAQTAEAQSASGTGETAASSRLAEYQRGWQPSAETAAARDDYEKSLAAKPAAWEDPYGAELGALYDEISRREPFSWDMDGDTLYRQYRDQYAREGRRAMEDTMGTAAALTGGYGSTYAQTAGQEAYERSLSALNERIPELYGAALDRYTAEGNALADRYGMLYRQREADREIYRDAVDDWETAARLAGEKWKSLRDYDYETWSRGLDYWTERADREEELAAGEAAAAASGKGGSGGRSGGGTGASGGRGKTAGGGDAGESVTPESRWGRYAVAIDRRFTENAYGMFDLPKSREQYLEYYRNEGLITQGEYRALLRKPYGEGA